MSKQKEVKGSEASKKLSIEEIEAKCEELSKGTGTKVVPMIVTVDEEQIVGYFQEPSYDTIMYAVDAILNKQASLGNEAAFKDCLLPESDPRISSSERKYARIKATFTNGCLKLILPYVDEYKKK